MAINNLIVSHLPPQKVQGISMLGSTEIQEDSVRAN